MLLGIHAQAFPVYLFKLPSGISVFKSPFTDIFGSRLCFGGTHESFKKSATEPFVSHAVHFMSALSNTQSVMNMATETVLCNINEKLLPGKNCVGTRHQSFSLDGVDPFGTQNMPQGNSHSAVCAGPLGTQNMPQGNSHSAVCAGPLGTQNMPQSNSHSAVCAGSLGTSTRQSFDMNGIMQHIFNHWGSLCYLGHEFEVVRWLKKCFLFF